eukprot:3493459-Prorocentrum_lima.AAC.1
MNHASEHTTEVSSWRSRHYTLRAACIRDTITYQDILVKYTPCKSIIADGLPKVLQKETLKEAQE